MADTYYTAQRPLRIRHLAQKSHEGRNICREPDNYGNQYNPVTKKCPGLIYNPGHFEVGTTDIFLLSSYCKGSRQFSPGKGNLTLFSNCESQFLNYFIQISSSGFYS